MQYVILDWILDSEEKKSIKDIIEITDEIGIRMIDKVKV